MPCNKPTKLRTVFEASPLLSLTCSRFSIWRGTISRASGIILTADGYIATNYHAVQGADAVEIRFFRVGCASPRGEKKSSSSGGEHRMRNLGLEGNADRDPQNLHVPTR